MAQRFAPFVFSGLTIVSLMLSGCGNRNPVSMKDNDSGNSLTAGGSSFVYPVMNRWTSDYNKKTGVQVNYNSLGSSGGVKQFMERTLDFGMTDAPMKDEQLAEAKEPIVHVPLVMGAVALTYNLPDLKAPLTLSGEVIGNIYLGKVTRWDDPSIAALNPGVTLPQADIVTVRRSDGSGTTYILTDFLSKTNAEWKEKIGVGNSPKWNKDSIGGKGNEGVAALVSRTPNTIGYIELLYAAEIKMPVASIISADGKPVAPSSESVTAAAASMTSVPEDLRMSITNNPGENAYPISGMTWAVARTTMPGKAKAQAIKDFLEFTLSEDCQARANTMNYSRLPENLRKLAQDKVNLIQGTK